MAHDPLYQPKKKKSIWLLAFDSWVDSSFFESGRSASRAYQGFYDFMNRFHVSGMKRVFVELASDAASFAVIGGILTTMLAIPAFEVTASGKWNQPIEHAMLFLDRYGNEIGRRGSRQDDSFKLEELPDALVQATLATEDRRFYSHIGVDFIGTTRALVSNMRGNALEGGSTITQQLAKNLFLTSEQTITRKINEAFLSVWLESNYTKDEILKLYFDTAYMGGGVFGVAAASEFYFDKSVKDISLAEAAMLTGLYKAPSRYAPHVDLAASRLRANEVLTNLVQAGFMTEGQVTIARRTPAAPVEYDQFGDAPNYFLDWLYEYAKPIVIANSNKNSFIVQTTIDPALQRIAEDVLTGTLRESGERYNVSQGGMAVVDKEGQIRAMVGGLDYGKSQYNRAAAPTRQPGSSFKPFVYATALESGMTPETTAVDGPFCIRGWCPHNYGRNYRGRVTLRTALARSINIIPVKLAAQIGRQRVADMTHAMGITTDFPVTASMPLGTASISVLDMAGAFTTFMNEGRARLRYGVLKITDLSGNQIFNAETDLPEPKQVMKPSTATYMNSMLRGVVTGGTGRRAQVEGVPAVGKTGTTSSYRDAWFVGYTGNYSAAVWLGNDNYTPSNRLTGGRLPAMTWQRFIEAAHANIQVRPLAGVEFTPRVASLEDETEEGVEALPQAPQRLFPGTSLTLQNLARDLRDAWRATLDRSETASLGLDGPQESPAENLQPLPPIPAPAFPRPTISAPQAETRQSFLRNQNGFQIIGNN